MERANANQPENDSAGEDIDANGQVINSMKFRIHRMLIYILLMIAYAMALFDRNCPSIVAKDIARDYGVQVSDIGIFTSIYYYAYAILQPFTGLIVDVSEPGYVIAISQLVGAIGTIICAFSPNLHLGSFGRVLVGLGCGPTYVSICRCLVNWFPLDKYPVMLGILHAVGSVGYLIAQFPLAWLSDLITWRWALFAIAMLGLVVSVLCFFFARGNPLVFHYPPVNRQLDRNPAEIPIRDKLAVLWDNFKTVCSYWSYWMCILYSFLSNGPYYNMNGMWASQFLIDIYDYDEQGAGLIMTSMTVGSIVGPIIVPLICELFSTKKIPLVISAACGALFAFVLGYYYFDFPYGWKLHLSLIACFFLFSVTSSVTSIYIALACSYFDPNIAGSAVGFLNMFTFIVSAIYQAISSEIIYKYPNPEKENAYLWQGYQYGVWLFSAISFLVSIVVGMIMKDAAHFKNEDDPEDIPKSMDTYVDDKDEISSHRIENHQTA